MIVNKPLFIFEMANNHQGSVEHGVNLICALKEAVEPFRSRFDFAVKFQYRDLDTFIHPDYQNRVDIKNVKRFTETKLTDEQFKMLLEAVRESSFFAVCTPFDETSVAKIVDQGFDYIKIASCSFTDWNLLEAIAGSKLPVIASGAGSTLQDVDNVVAFFKNREIPLTLMHCVAEYPTPVDRLQLNQIDLYRKRYPWVVIGYSTHEDPNNTSAISLAVAKGALVFEKHVGLPTSEIKLNAYSANPTQIGKWLEAAACAFDMCGETNGRYIPMQKEIDDLAALKRGVFVKKENVGPCELKKNDYYLAFPCVPGQLTADKLSKYNKIVIKNCLKKDQPIMMEDVTIQDNKAIIYDYVKQILKLLKKGNTVIPKDAVCTLSHHYGIENFGKYGITMLDCLNREYCKKFIVVLPGQYHPEQYHLEKEESFLVQYGTLHCVLNGEEKIVRPGEYALIERGMHHAFWSEDGCIIEELSTTHDAADSYYIDADHFVPERKTKIHIRQFMD